MHAIDPSNFGSDLNKCGHLLTGYARMMHETIKNDASSAVPVRVIKIHSAQMFIGVLQVSI